MAVGSFNQKISLEGAEDIKRLLAEIGQAGQRAFAQIEAGATGASARLTVFSAAVAAARVQFASISEAAGRFGASVRTLGNSLGNFSSGLLSSAARLTLMAAGITAVGFGLVSFGRASAEAGDEVLKTAQSLGLSVEAYQRLGFAASQSGLDLTQFARAMTALNKLVQEGVQEQNKALFNFSSGISQSMRIAIREVSTGGSTIGESMRLIGQLAGQLQERLRGLGINIPLPIIEEQLRRMATGTAEMRKQFDLLAGGSVEVAKTALEKFGLSVETGGNALRKLGVQMVDIATGKARPLEDILGDVAEAFSKMPDGVEKSAKAVDIFGQRIGPKLIPLLNAGRAGLRDLADEFSRTTTGFTTAQAKAAEAMNDAFSSLGTTIAGVRNQLAAPLFGPLEKAAKSIQQVIANNSKAIQEFGDAIAAKVIPVIEDFVHLIAGRDSEIQNTWIIKARDGIVAFGSAVRGAILNVVIPALSGLKAILDVVASAVNTLFRTRITGGELGIGLLVLAFTGVLGAITNVIIAVGALAVALTRLAAHPVILALTLFAATIANLVGLYQDVTREADPFQKKLEEINKEFARTGDREKYLQQMRALDSTQRTAATSADGQLTKLVALSQQYASGAITAQEYSQQLAAATTSTNAIGTAAQQSGFRVRELGNSSGFAVRELATAGGIAVREVRAIGQAAQQVGTATQQGLGQVEQEMRDLTGASDQVEGGFNDVRSAGDRLGSVSVNPVAIGLQQLIQLLIELVRQANAAAGALRDVGGSTGDGAVGGGGGGGGGGGFARGGYTGSIGARRIAGFVHGNEYVQPAHVVRQPGVLGFLELLRRTGGDLEAAIARFSRGYSMGGFVEGLNRSLSQLAIPSFASGGFAEAIPARSGRDLGTIGLDFGRGGQVKVVGDEMTFDSLQRVSVRLARLSAGKKF